LTTPYTLSNLILGSCILLLTAGPPSNARANLSVTATVTNVTGPAHQSGTGIVYNGSITASATGGTAPYTYYIDPAVIQNNGYFPELAAGTYTVVATDATGQQTTTTVTITYVYPQPSVTFSNLAQPSSCNSADGAFTINATGGTPPYTYSIDAGYTYTSNNVFTNLTQGTYEILVKDANGQLGKLPVDPVTKNLTFLYLIVSNCALAQFGTPTFLPSCVNSGSVEINIGSYTSVDSFSLDGLHYRDIPFSHMIPFNSENVYYYDSTGLAPGLYHFYLKEDATVTVISKVCDVECFVQISSISIDASCGGSDGGFQVIATKGYPPYTYSIDGVNYQTSNTFTGLSSGLYSVTVKDFEGVTYSGTANIFNKCPTVSAVTTNDVCSQHNGTITATGQKGTLPYQFSSDGTNFQASNTFTSLPAGNYTVTIKDNLGFKSTTTVTIAAWCLSVSGTPTSAECGNANGTITATGAGGKVPYAYSIDGINFQSSNLFTGLPPGNYTLTVKDGTGNTAGTPMTITGISGPTMSVTSQPAFCDNTGGGLSIQAVGGTAPYSYSIDGMNYQTTNTFNLIPGPYKVWLKDDLGCSTSLPASVSITNNLTLDAGNPVTICQGSSTNLIATSNGTSFAWSPTNGLTNSAVLQPTVDPATSTTYTCTATWGTCQQQASVTVTVNPGPTPSAGQDMTVCYGQSTQLSGSGGVTYNWSPASGLNNPTIANPTVRNPDQSITYQLSVTDQNGCTSMKPASVTIHVTPQAELSAGNDTSVLTGEPLQLHAVDINGSGFTSYNWTPATDLNNSSIADPIATLTTSTTYTVTAQTPAGCQATTTLNVKVYYTIGLFVPNAFTPNGDGHNDVLKVIPYGIRQLQSFAIYNRWGQRIFYTENPSQGWDGTLNGQPQPSGPYVWMAAGVDLDGRFLERKGSVVLIR